MAEPFKNLVSRASTQQIADALSAADRGFPAERFHDRANEGLEALELKARVAHVADTLRTCLPTDWLAALDWVLRALPAPHPDEDGVTELAWLWPLLTLVERHGLHHPEASLDALHAMTQRFSAEFAIRPYLTQHPELAWARLEAWVADPNHHVRRLVSEGSRPRLPWGGVLRESVADPSRGLVLLSALVDDPSAYVRRSVANHLNDVCKDHPDQALATARSWLGQSTPHRVATVTRGLRTLVKRGDSRALALLGLGPARTTLHALVCDPAVARLGEHTVLRANLSAHADQEWLVDWVIRSPRADGSLGRRVMRGCRRHVLAGQRVDLAHRLSLKAVTTRVDRPGEWRVGLQLNGELVSELRFQVQAPLG